MPKCKSVEQTSKVKLSQRQQDFLEENGYINLREWRMEAGKSDRLKPSIRTEGSSKSDWYHQDDLLWVVHPDDFNRYWKSNPDCLAVETQIIKNNEYFRAYLNHLKELDEIKRLERVEND